MLVLGSSYPYWRRIAAELDQEQHGMDHRLQHQTHHLCGEHVHINTGLYNRTSHLKTIKSQLGWQV